MKMTLCSTSRIIDVNGIQTRLWEGTTEKGIPVHCLVVRIAANTDANQEEFKNDLQECKPPSDESLQAFHSARLLL